MVFPTVLHTVQYRGPPWFFLGGEVSTNIRMCRLYSVDDVFE